MIRGEYKFLGCEKEAIAEQIKSSYSCWNDRVCICACNVCVCACAHACVFSAITGRYFQFIKYYLTTLKLQLKNKSSRMMALGAL